MTPLGASKFCPRYDRIKTSFIGRGNIDSGMGPTPAAAPTRPNRRGLQSEIYSSWSLDATGGTPKRKKENVYEADTVQLNPKQVEAKRRFQNCTGLPVLRVSPKLEQDKRASKKDGTSCRGACLVCDERTSYFCLLCREWYCFGWQDCDCHEGAEIFKVPLGIENKLVSNQDGTKKRVNEGREAVC